MDLRDYCGFYYITYSLTSFYVGSLKKIRDNTSIFTNNLKLMEIDCSVDQIIMKKPAPKRVGTAGVEPLSFRPVGGDTVCSGRGKWTGLSDPVTSLSRTTSRPIKSDLIWHPLSTRKYFSGLRYCWVKTGP